MQYIYICNIYNKDFICRKYVLCFLDEAFIEEKNMYSCFFDENFFAEKYKACSLVTLFAEEEYM